MSARSFVVTSNSTEDWFSALIRKHRTDAVRFAWGLLGHDANMAEEMVQRALVKAWYRRATFRGEAKLKTWLYRIIVNEVRSYQRWRQVRIKAASLLKLSVQDTLKSESPTDVGLRRRIEDALSRLTPPQREVFVLVSFQGYTVREAAELLGRSEGTVKTHSHRARLKLKAELADLWRND